jgi:hypothetical protein
MKFLVIMWILSLTDLSGQRIRFNGSLDDCLQQAIQFNKEETDAMAGCYLEAKQPNYQDRGSKNAY